MNSLTVLISLTSLSASTWLGLMSYVLWVRHRSWRDFMDHRRGRQILELVSVQSTPRITTCACCGRDANTSANHPDCVRNYADAQMSKSV